MPTGPYLCLYQILSQYFKPNTQGFNLEIHSGAVTRKQPQQRLSLLHVTHLLFDTNASTKYMYYQNMSKGIKVMEDFGFWGNNYIIKKKVRVVSLACNTPTGPPLHLYQILTNYLKHYGSYGLHEISASGEITTSLRVSYLYCMVHASSSFLPNIIKICLRVSKLWSAQDFGFRGGNYIIK